VKLPSDSCCGALNSRYIRIFAFSITRRWSYPVPGTQKKSKKPHFAPNRLDRYDKSGLPRETSANSGPSFCRSQDYPRSVLLSGHLRAQGNEVCPDLEVAGDERGTVRLKIRKGTVIDITERKRAPRSR
jgi:hypothetical protein